jgi:hypothetical protein
MTMECKIKKMAEGMKLKGPYRGTDINMTLNPGEEKIALIRVAGNNYALGYSQLVGFE